MTDHKCKAAEILARCLADADTEGGAGFPIEFINPCEVLVDHIIEAACDRMEERLAERLNRDYE